ncbi:hypothetical protein D3C72_2541220 [compost metagenome]
MDLTRIIFDIACRTEIIGADRVDEQIIERINAAQGEQSEEQIVNSLEQGITGLKLFSQVESPP